MVLSHTSTPMGLYYIISKIVARVNPLGKENSVESQRKLCYIRMKDLKVAADIGYKIFSDNNRRTLSYV